MEHAKGERATSKRLLTMSQNRVEKAMAEKLSSEIVQSRFREVEKRLCELMEKHERYLTLAYPDDEPVTEDDESWFKDVTDRYDKLENKVKIMLNKIASAKLKTSYEDKLFAISKECKYEEMLLVTAIDNLTMMATDEDVASETIKEAQIELKNRLDSYCDAQKRLSIIAVEETAERETKRVHELMTRVTKANIAAGKTVE